ncbi:MULTISPECIES: pectinesterase family protein [unclassified Fibrobacter]|uniref:pectinesterase family protein n=1 Tax=unclassified Fibrobacter TaxID=2634177 RepID=UPI001E31326B|nr:MULTISPECIES: pectinesterase family protein [unclassified Fibrobacter]
MAAGFVTDAFGITKKKIDFVVGVDGDFKAAIAAASAAKPSENNRFIIFFPDGEYDLTKVTADRHGKTTFTQSFVSLIGQTRDKAIIANKTDTESIGHTATLYFSGNNGMYMQDLTIQNKSTYCGASACRQVTIQQNSGDKYIFKNVKLVSGQDTYYTKGGRSYWEGGEIQGTVDFICGGGDVFFEGTNLVVKKNGGYITASQNPGNYGYVFNNTKLNASGNNVNGTFYLGRSWGHAKTAFLNTTMYAQPTAEGWGPDMNSAPVVFGEYNSKNGNGGAVDVSRRRTYFNGGKDASTATTLKTVWNASDAAKYTLANVMGGSDGWAPNKLTVQVAAPKISQDGADITWADDENALCWVVFVNGQYKGSTATNSFPVQGIAAGSKVTVRAANSMGGLGSYSNEITTVEDNSTYFNVKLESGVGGTIQSSLSGNKVAEGKTVTFTAKANGGWKFAGWSGASATTIDASSTTIEIKATRDIQLTASFTGAGTGVFQAEDGSIENAVYESTNAGFKGSGYVNFGAGNSYVNIPVDVDAAGTYKMGMFYANGSSQDRDLIIKVVESGASASSETLTFEKTGAWTTYLSKETEITLPKGISHIQFAVVGSNDGPNLDQIILTPKKVEVPADTTLDDPTLSLNGNLQQNLICGNVKVQLFSVQGKFLRNMNVSNLNELSKTGLGIPAGSYLIKISATGYRLQKVIRIQ